MGSANAVVADDSNGDGFWMVTEEVSQAQLGSAELDPLLDEPEHWEETVCTQIEGTEMDLQWCGPADWLTTTGRTRCLRRKRPAPLSHRLSRMGTSR